MGFYHPISNLLTPHPNPACRERIPPCAHVGDCLALGSNMQGAFGDPWTQYSHKWHWDLELRGPFCTLQVALGGTLCPKPNWQPYCLQEGVETPLVGTQDPQDPAFVPKCLTWAPWTASWDVPFTHTVVQAEATPQCLSYRGRPEACPPGPVQTSVLGTECVRAVQGRAGEALSPGHPEMRSSHGCRGNVLAPSLSVPSWCASSLTSWSWS